MCPGLACACEQYCLEERWEVVHDGEIAHGDHEGCCTDEEGDSLHDKMRREDGLNGEAELDQQEKEEECDGKAEGGKDIRRIPLSEEYIS